MLVTIRHGVVCVRFRSHTFTVIGQAKHSPCPSLPSSLFGFSAQLYLFLFSIPTASGLGCHRPPTGVGYLCFTRLCVVVTASGLVPSDHRGFYSLTVVVLELVHRWWCGPPSGHLPV